MPDLRLPITEQANLSPERGLTTPKKGRRETEETMIATGFNKQGETNFMKWVEAVAKYPEQMNTQAWFNSMEYADLKRVEIAR